MSAVPGIGMYNMMLSMLNSDFDSLMRIGTETLLVAGSIAIAMVIVLSLISVVQAIRQHPKRR